MCALYIVVELLVGLREDRSERREIGGKRDKVKGNRGNGWGRANPGLLFCPCHGSYVNTLAIRTEGKRCSQLPGGEHSHTWPTVDSCAAVQLGVDP